MKLTKTTAVLPKKDHSMNAEPKLKTKQIVSKKATKSKLNSTDKKRSDYAVVVMRDRDLVSVKNGLNLKDATKLAYEYQQDKPKRTIPESLLVTIYVMQYKLELH